MRGIASGKSNVITKEESSKFNLLNFKPLIFGVRKQNSSNVDACTSQNWKNKKKLKNLLCNMPNAFPENVHFRFNTLTRRSAFTFFHEYLMNFSLNFIKINFLEKITFTFWTYEHFPSSHDKLTLSGWCDFVFGSFVLLVGTLVWIRGDSISNLQCIANKLDWDWNSCWDCGRHLSKKNALN